MLEAKTVGYRSVSLSSARPQTMRGNVIKFNKRTNDRFCPGRRDEAERGRGEASCRVIELMKNGVLEAQRCELRLKATQSRVILLRACSYLLLAAAEDVNTLLGGSFCFALLFRAAVSSPQRLDCGRWLEPFFFFFFGLQRVRKRL